MTMNTRRSSLTDADWERLSAYVDRALPPAERRAVEARLARDPAWQAALAELRALRAALRNLPTPSRPRSFVLSPAAVSPRRGWWPRMPRAWPAWAGAMAVLVLALVVGWGVWSLRPLAGAPPVRLEAAAPATEAGPVAAEQAAAAPAPSEDEVAGAAKAANEAAPDAAAPLAPPAAPAEEGASPRPSASPTPTPTPVAPRAPVVAPSRRAPVGLAALCGLGGLLVVGVGLWALVRRRR